MSVRQAFPIVVSLLVVFGGILWASYHYAREEALRSAHRKADQISGTIVSYEEFYRARVESEAARLAEIVASLEPGILPSSSELFSDIEFGFSLGRQAVTLRMLDMSGRYIVRHYQPENGSPGERKAFFDAEESPDVLSGILSSTGYRAGWHSGGMLSSHEGILMAYSFPLRFHGYHSRRSGRQKAEAPTIFYARPEIYGLITVTLSIPWFEERLRHALPLKNSLFFLLAPDNSWSLPALLEEYGLQLGTTDQKAVEDLKRQMQRRLSGQSGITLHGETYMVLYVPVLSKGVMLGLLLPRREFLGDVQILTFKLLILGVLFSLAAFRLVQRSTIRMLRPLTGLASTARHLARGEVGLSVFPSEEASGRGSGETEKLLEASKTLRDTMRERMRRLALLALARTRLAGEFQLAERILAGLLPASLPSFTMVDLRVENIRDSHVGGELYDCIDLGHGRLGLIFCHADIPGLPSALLMCRVMPLLREIMLDGKYKPAKALEHVNMIIQTHRHGQGGGAFSKSVALNVFVGVFHMGSGRFSWAGAGWSAPFIIKNNPRGPDPLRSYSWRLSGPRGVSLGLTRHTTYTESEVLLAPGDMLFFCNDNLLQARDDKGDVFGEQRLQAVISMSGARAEKMLRAIRESLASHTEGAPSGAHLFFALAWEGAQDPVCSSSAAMSEERPEKDG